MSCRGKSRNNSAELMKTNHFMTTNELQTPSRRTRVRTPQRFGVAQRPHVSERALRSTCIYLLKYLTAKVTNRYYKLLRKRKSTLIEQSMH